MLNLHFKSPSFLPIYVCSLSPFLCRNTLSHSGIVMHANDLKVLCVVPMKIPDQLKKQCQTFFPFMKRMPLPCVNAISHIEKPTFVLRFFKNCHLLTELSEQTYVLPTQQQTKATVKRFNFYSYAETGVVCSVCFSYQHFLCGDEIRRSVEPRQCSYPISSKKTLLM